MIYLVRIVGEEIPPDQQHKHFLSRGYADAVLQGDHGGQCPPWWVTRRDARRAQLTLEDAIACVLLLEGRLAPGRRAIVEPEDEGALPAG